VRAEGKTERESMARGQKYSEEIRERAFALIAAGESCSAVARTLGIPRTTLKGWQDSQSTEEKESREELHRRHKERFAEDAWQTIHFGNEILTRRFERAARNEREMDRLLEAFLASAETLSAEQLKALLKKFGELQLMDVGKVAVVMGTLYDKQALIAKEATARVELAELKFEEL